MKTFQNIKRTPLVRIAIIYIIGILVANSLEQYLLKWQFYVLTSTLTGLIVIIATYISNKHTILFKYLYIPVIIGLAFCVYAFTINLPQNFENEHIREGLIYEKPLLKNNSILIPVKIHPDKFTFGKICRTVRIHIYTDKDSTIANNIKIGNSIRLKTKLSRIKNYGNPDEFNYSRHMLSEGIQLQGYCKASVIQISKTNRLPLKRFLVETRDNGLKLFKTSLKNPDAVAIASALTLGYRKYLSYELQQSFIDAGAIHVLAVSGLHVGILYVFLNFLFGIFNNSKSQRLIRSILIILIIWLYAMLTGLSPSVTRAALMFTLLSIGKTYSRDISFYNILGATALILLIANPFLLYNVGFQLSFLAVGGIVFFHPLIYRILITRNIYLNYIIQLLSVSISAQLITAPLTLFYFHQFPSYFWLTNLLLIPLISISLIGSIIFIVTSWIPVLGNITGSIINSLYSITSQWVKMINNIPYATIEEINIPISQVITIYLIIVLGTTWLLTKKHTYLILSLTTILISVTMPFVKDITYKQQPQIIFYNLPRSDYIGIYSKTSNYLIYSDKKKINNNVNKYFKSHWNSSLQNQNLKVIDIDSLTNDHCESQKTSLLRISLTNNKHLLLYNKSKFSRIEEPSEFVFVTNNTYPPADALITKNIILSNTLKRRVKNRWHKYSNINKLRIIDIEQTGAIVVPL